MNAQFWLKNLTTEKISIFIILLFHLIGAWGIAYSDNPMFKDLTVMHLGFMAFIFLFNINYTKKKALYLLSLIVLSILIEAIGVSTGSIFGWYKYKDGLGFKIAEVPVLIGFNWMMLVFGAGLASYSIVQNKFLQPVLGALLLTLLDVFIEPQSCKLEYWCWNTGTMAPPQNFIAWFVVSLLLLIPFRFIQPETENRVPVFLLIAQYIFFIILNLS